ncbi:MAG: protease pro-enzyme activation domain-containing protein [Acidobacteriaceae bacterium]
MKRRPIKKLPLPSLLSLAVGSWLTLGVTCLTLPALAQTTTSAAGQASTAQPQARITGPIDDSVRVPIPHSHPPQARAADDIGPVSGNMPLQGMALLFSRSAAQQAALDALVAAQQNPASPLYHHWITPDQYAAQFGAAQSDINAAENWLQQQGFTVDSVSRNHARILFSGTAAQVASAFGAPLHNYRFVPAGAQTAVTHFAPSADITIPAALSAAVMAVENLNDFRPHAHFRMRPPQALAQDNAQAHFTSSQTGNIYLDPDDVDTIYDVTPLINSGYNGSGESITVVGQSAFVDSDLENFQNALGIPNKLPNVVLVPDTGSSTLDDTSSDSDEVESDIDLEYSEAMAQGAEINFVYTGNSTNSGGALQALEYAVENNLGDIISSSYGTCEPALGLTGYNSYNSYLEEAASQGQTVVAAAGDSGSTDCYGQYSTSDTTDNEQLAVDFPGSSQYVTSVGGTEFPIPDIAPGNSYFDTQSSTDIVSSAKSYVPEEVWNDDAGDAALGATGASALSSGGGGVSVFSPIQPWQSQSGVPGIPANSSNRMVPDVALYASPSEPDIVSSNPKDDTIYGGYLICSSDENFTGVTGSCSHGFRDANDAYLTVAGGTSFAAPIFAGMLAILDQAKGYSSTNGQGSINRQIYTLAANSSTYASAFHDITQVGSDLGNNCAAGTTICGTGADTTNYYAGTGFDEASGLGSVDFANLVGAWPRNSSTSQLLDTTTTVSAATLTPATGANDTITITVAPQSGSSTSSTAPTGTVSVSVNGGTATSVTLTNGVATYTFSGSANGIYVIDATFSGSSTYATSNGAVTLTIGPSTSPSSVFGLAASNVSVSPGSSATGSITVTPAAGFAGTVALSVNAGPLTDGCVIISPTSVSITSTVSVNASYTVYTSTSACAAVGAFRRGSRRALPRGSRSGAFSPSRAPFAPRSPYRRIPLPATLASVLLFAGLGRRSHRLRSRLLRGSLALGLLLALFCGGFGLIGCSGSNSSNTTTPPASTNTPAGAYTLTITGGSGAVTSSTTFTVTVT